jgi:hypothetical protein
MMHMLRHRAEQQHTVASSQPRQHLQLYTQEDSTAQHEGQLVMHVARQCAEQQHTTAASSQPCQHLHSE